MNAEKKPFDSWEMPESRNIGGYELLEPLGRGGFGLVYLALQKSTGQKVALKHLLLDEEFDEQRRRRKMERFEREVRLCADLHHPHIIKLLDKGWTNHNQLFAVFEYVPGKTLAELLFERGALPPLEARELMAQILDALACAHEKGVVHRDLKPQNIIISQTGVIPQAKVLDFGIGAFTPEARKTEDKALTLTQETIGTPFYSAPEQLRGEPPTTKSDLYSWGLVLLETLTGVRVIKGTKLAEIFHQQLNQFDIPLPTAIAGHPLGNLLRRVLQKDPSERAGDTREIHRKLRSLELNNLVGKFKQPGNHQRGLEDTQTLEGWIPFNKLQQLTVLSCCLGVEGDATLDFEALDTLLRNQQSFILDTCQKYGGHQVGTLGNSLMFYFGYPNVSDHDARRTARAALEMMEKVKYRSALLEDSHGIRMSLKVGIHTGTVLVGDEISPDGATPNTALELEKNTDSNSIIVSKASHSLLKFYLEFEQSLKGYLMMGEHPAESWSFLRPGSRERPLLGRNEDMQVLVTHWKEVKEKKGSAVLLIGEAGIGKSRLLHEMRHQVREEGASSRECRCQPEQKNNALFPFLEMIKRRCHLSESHVSTSAVERLEIELKKCTVPLEISMPILCSWMSFEMPKKYEPLPHSPNRQKNILLDILEQLILGNEDESPFLLVLEDFHWIDPTSEELLERLLQKISSSSVFIVITSRPTNFEKLDSTHVNHLLLDRLSLEQSQEMIQMVLDQHPVEPTVLRQIAERTDGIPLFVEELSSMLVDKGFLIVKDDQYVLNEDIDTNSIPITLKDLLNEKLEKLGMAEETIQIAAAIGKEFDYSLLVRVSLKDEASIQSDLERILASGLIVKQRRAGMANYIFRHALIRDAAYDGMIHAAQEFTHARIAESLARDFPDRGRAEPAFLAYHYSKAGQYENAIDYMVCAAESALHRALNDETVVHSEKALQWIAKIPDNLRPSIELKINGMLTQAMMGIYGWADSRVKEKADRSQQLLNHVPDDAQKVPVLWSLGLFHHVASNRKEVRFLADELLRIAQQSGNRNFQVAALNLSGLAHYTDGEYPQAMLALENATQNFDFEEEQESAKHFGLDPFVWSSATLSLVKWLCGDSKGAWECAETTRDCAIRLEHIPSQGIELLYRANLYHFMEEREKAQEVSQELIDLSEKYDLPAFSGYASLVHAWATDNIELIDSIIGFLQGMGCRLGLSYYGSYAAEISIRQGNFQDALTRLDHCLVTCDEIGEYLYQAELHRLKASVLIQSGASEDAFISKHLTQAIQIAHGQGLLRTEARALTDFSERFDFSEEQNVRLQMLLQKGVLN